MSRFNIIPRHPDESCSTCTAIVPHNGLLIVRVHVPRLNGELIPAEIDVCEECALDLECVVLMDTDGSLGGFDGIKVRERVTT